LHQYESLLSDEVVKENVKNAVLQHRQKVIKTELKFPESL